MDLTQLLQPIADWFAGLGLPEPIVHWGHPLMMGIVVLVMGAAVGIAGWRGRTATDETVAAQNRTAHRRIVLWMFTFMAAGYSGGLLSLVMQHQAILESPHFWTGSIILALLAINGLISKIGFRQQPGGAGQEARFRTLHAYLGSATLGLMFLHAVLGLKLGLSI